MEHSTRHAKFVIRRALPARPATVFRAFADPATKSRWQDSPDVESVESQDPGYLEFDFRVGGHERFDFKIPDGPTYSYDAEYFDIVPDRRIVYWYRMHADGRPDSISLVSVELTENGNDTDFLYTEQVVFLDGIDEPAAREEGITDLIENLRRYLAATAEIAD